jgi:Spy/CpxP family protein refolding chaperone
MIKRLTSVVGLAAMLAGLTFAQHRGGAPDPHAMIQMRVDRMAAQLSLTDTQKARATAIFTDAFTAGQSIQADLHTNRQSLEDAVKKNCGD